ncbi:MAG: CRISPR-associated helicase Cas3', partial [Spirochaetales bacterium]|nr:CRISPR-associated helicase Cas3' [Spirochaetales bacterium]
LGEGNGTGCFVALPTMATSNAMYERMAEVYASLYKPDSHPSLTLSHGSRHLSEAFRNSFESLPHEGVIYDEKSDEGKAHRSQWLADSSKKALLADVGVGTIDQVLLAGLPVRYQSLRAFGMSQKVLIVDEVHAFDAYMLRLLENIITAQAAFGGSVILLSATLPFLVREKFCNAFSSGLGFCTVSLDDRNSFPVVTSVTAQNGVTEQAVETRKSVTREVIVDFCEAIEDVYVLIEQSVDEGKCVCWIRNTITDVTTSFEELQGRGVENLDMFHSRFALNDRLSIEKRVLARFGKSSNPDERRSHVLVASQVVEQSLDLDFDVMISDLAPIDLLIQRAGRLHRHERGKRDKPVFYVHIPKDTDNPTAEWYADTFPTAKWVYRDTALLWRTKEILKQQKRLKMPEEARLLIESVYGDEETIKVPDVFNSSEDEAWGKKMADKSYAEFNKLNFDKGYCPLA